MCRPRVCLPCQAQLFARVGASQSCLFLFLCFFFRFCFALLLLLLQLSITTTTTTTATTTTTTTRTIPRSLPEIAPSTSPDGLLKSTFGGENTPHLFRLRIQIKCRCCAQCDVSNGFHHQPQQTGYRSRRVPTPKISLGFVGLWVIFVGLFPAMWRKIAIEKFSKSLFGRLLFAYQKSFPRHLKEDISRSGATSCRFA